MQYYVEILGALFMDLVMFFSRRNPDRPQPLPLSQPAPVSEARANCGPRNVLFLYRDESEKKHKTKYQPEDEILEDNTQKLPAFGE